MITQVNTLDDEVVEDPMEESGGFLSIFRCCVSAEPHYPMSTLGGSSNAELLLPPPLPQHGNKKCLVLDLDETLVHSSFKPVPEADFIVPVEIDDQVHQVYVLKRPHVDEFMKQVGELFEVVVFTASVPKYADPVIDLLDIHQAVHYRLFRDGCVQHQGSFVKDLSRLGRDLQSVAIVDNSAASYLFHPQNAIPIKTWLDDRGDSDLLTLLPFLEELAACDDVRRPIKAKYG